MKYFYVTVLSNLEKGLNLKDNIYSKAGIPESTFSDKFYLTTYPDLKIGINKAKKLLTKVNIPDDRVIVLETELNLTEVQPNRSTGLGVFINQNFIKVSKVYCIDLTDNLIPLFLREALFNSNLINKNKQNSLTYKEYRDGKNELLKLHPHLLRLDCMNPYKKMECLLNDSSQDKEGTNTKIIKFWKKQTNVVLSNEIVVSSGVRDSIKAIFRIFKGKTVWIPADVYPVYFELAEGLVSVKTFSTYPKLDLDFLAQAGKEDIILLPNPVSPLGRFLNQDEILKLKLWLIQSSNRYLILDQVYNYSHDTNGSNSLPKDQVFTFWALSKSWILPVSFGINCIPVNFLKDFSKEVLNPTQLERNQIYSQLLANPDFPLLQEKLFHKKWELLAPKIKEIDPDWKIPEVGYFSTLNKSYTELISKGVLAVPASVFGHSNPNISIITCLFNLLD